jgi:hypothetical protein
MQIIWHGRNCHRLYFYQLMFVADWVEHAWEEQNMSVVNCHIMEPLWWLWQKLEGNVVVVVIKYVLVISTVWGCGTLVGFSDDTDSALGPIRTKICFSVPLHIDCSGKIVCWLGRWISLVKEMIVCNFILTNSKIEDPFQSCSYLHEEISVSEPDIHCSDLRSIYVVHLYVFI